MTLSSCVEIPLRPGKLGAGGFMFILFRFFAVLFFVFVTFYEVHTQAVTGSETVIKKQHASSSDVASTGPFGLVEWNPADLMHQRIKIDGEYLIVDGFSFGVLGEYQRKRLEKFEHTTGAFGISATQYFGSQSLKGLFIKGESNVFGTTYKLALEEGNKQGDVFGLGLGADLGYRFVFGNYFTGGASYGVRRIMPNFFDADGTEPPPEYSSHTDLWDVRIQLSLGIVL